jgi:hydroxypyruvate isomerase
MKHQPNRRDLLGAAVGTAALSLCGSARADPTQADWRISQGRLNQSVIRWCFDPISVEVLARGAAAMGLKSVELIEPKDWPILKKYNLVCAITPSHGFTNAWNHVENHAMCIDKITKSIDATSDAGFPNVITFSGMRQGIDEETGFKNTVDGLKKVIGLAEKKKVTLCFEVLNSRVKEPMRGHPGYQGDKLEWAVALCDRIGSERMKILFDIYHIQIMEGDVISRIRQYKDYIAHYHTAGVPGRHELDDQQEINYPPIMRAIAETGYSGFVGQEFVPRSAKTDDEKIASLREAVRVCDV